MRTVFWEQKRGVLKMIDQRLLPAEFVINEYTRCQEAVRAISEMVVRGAPAIGAAAGFGLALAGFGSKAATVKELTAELRQAAAELEKARPTAVNLSWALQRILDETVGKYDNVEDLQEAILRSAQRIADEDIEINRRMAGHGAELIEDGDTIIHHCNTGSLAAVDWGTALGVIHTAHEQGKDIHVLVDETRPRLQGARLTAWELDQYGISYDIISDNAAGYFLSTGQAQKVVFGADRAAANGDVANKIGTYMLALAADDNQVPVYAVIPTSTIDLSLASGELIPIEERAPDEVLGIALHGRRAAPEGATARNPAFDITPHRLITGIITENGVVFPPYDQNLPAFVSAP